MALRPSAIGGSGHERISANSASGWCTGASWAKLRLAPLDDYPTQTTRRVTLRLTSLLLVEEKLLEAEYFGRRLRLLATPEFDYELNAFLSAARSVTFLLQKDMARVSGFAAWWSKRQEVMRRDDAMRFFKNLRNRSQKRGRVLLVGTPRRHTDGTQVWSYRFPGE